MIEEIANFSFPPTYGLETSDGMPLYYNGQPTNTKISGDLIEKQYEYGNYFLIITSTRGGFEEVIHIILLDGKFEIKSKRFVGSPYCEFSIKTITITGMNRLIIEYRHGERFSLRLMHLPPYLYKAQIMFLTKLGMQSKFISCAIAAMFLYALVVLYLALPICLSAPIMVASIYCYYLILTTWF